MNSKEFKSVFGEIAKSNDFKQAFGGWYKESSECIAILELQKSNFSDSYYLNVKIFIQGIFGLKHSPSKNLIKSPMGDITNQMRDLDVLNFDNSISETDRIELLKVLFKDCILPFINNLLSKASIKEMADTGKICLLPAVKKELEKITHTI
ncbi:DUF4304 domain-containing protein [Chryseobacterium sp. SORGH_AS_0447]|uniref:DUF4304 domain-containing protein n=1 Tax=Chryseobacterium sp. SORGH_AS_0447 TaxID=3041769 RepID=UPI0027D8F071|nr:DUF4304 domain-containing protein [Chryseobacterium sp. SORGH_AS_0447]